MKTRMTILATLLVSGSALAMPDWITNYDKTKITDGKMSAFDCTATTGDFSLDRTVASTGARAELAKNIEVAILTETIINKDTATSTDSNNGETSTKATVSKEIQDKIELIAQQAIKGSHITKAEYVEMAGKQQFCVLVTADKPNVDEL